MPENREWYLVYCKAKREIVARDNLERQGYTVYLPIVRQTKRSKGKKINSTGPLFPRYLFVQLTQGLDNLSPIRSTIGVSHLVKFGQELVKVPGNLVQGLMENSSTDGIFDVKRIEFKPNDTARITDGVMAGYEGIIIARTGKERVQFLLNIVGNSNMNVEISDDLLELIT